MPVCYEVSTLIVVYLSIHNSDPIEHSLDTDVLPIVSKTYHKTIEKQVFKTLISGTSL